MVRISAILIVVFALIFLSYTLLKEESQELDVVELEVDEGVENVIETQLYVFDQEQECFGYGIGPEITSEQCEELDGVVINTADVVGCCETEVFLGTISDLRCPCICCIPD